MKFKFFLPIENYKLKSKLSVEEIRKRISENIETKKTFRFFSLKTTQ
jgi:hypothetical protein